MSMYFRDTTLEARVLEASGSSIRNFDDIRTVDVYGNRGRYGCWAYPDYRNCWAAVANDMFRSYELDGFQWGAERMGPIINVILPWNDCPPTCFCEHCMARGEAVDIDVGRTREGYTRPFEYVRGPIDGEPAPPEGTFTVLVRHLIRYPAILAWEYHYRLSRSGAPRRWSTRSTPSHPPPMSAGTSITSRRAGTLSIVPRWRQVRLHQADPPCGATRPGGAFECRARQNVRMSARSDASTGPGSPNVTSPSCSRSGKLVMLANYRS